MDKDPVQPKYQAQFEHRPSRILVPGNAVSTNDWPSAIPGTQEGRLQSIGKLRVNAADALQKNLPSSEDINVDDFYLVRMIVNTIEAPNEMVVEAEAEYRKARKDFDNY